MKGPKGILAEALAKALADFFVVDPVTMEANLIRDAGVKLHNTRLKTQVMQHSPFVTITIDGVVKYVAFQWQWGQSDKVEGGSDWVKDAKLTISGLNFTAKFAKDGQEASAIESTQKETTKESKDRHPVSPKTEEEEAKGIKAYIQNQVQRIIDTLTLNVTDFLFKIELPSGSSVEFGGDGLELLSLGRTEGTPLRQELSIASLFSNVLTESTSYPVLESISYKATVIRTFGKRFVSGIDKGLQVTGESSDAGIVIHTGVSQMQVFDELIALVLTPPSSTPASSESSPEDKDDESDIHYISEIFEDVSDEEDDTGPSSFFQLPMSAVSLVLPNNTKLSLSDLTLKYQMDGTILKVEGHAGFLVNGFPFLQLGETSLWCADVVTSEFRVFDGAHNVDEIVAFLHARKEEIENVIKGVNEALGIVERLRESDDGGLALLTETTTPAPEDKPKSKTTTPWSFRIEGEFGCLVEQGDTEAEFMLQNIQANMAEDISVVIGKVARAIVPGTLRLTKPVENTQFRFNGSSLKLTVGQLVIALEESETKPLPVIEESMLSSNPGESPAKPIESKDSTGDETSFALPFGILATVEKLIIHKPNGKPDGLSEFIMLGGIELQLTPQTILGEGLGGVELKLTPETTLVKETPANCRINLSLAEFNHDMIRLQKPILSTVVDLNDLDTLSSFHFGAANIAVASGYTVRDWKRLVYYFPHRQKAQKRKPQEPTEPINLPKAHVDPLKVKVVVASNLVGLKETVLRIGAFDGKATTTANDLFRFYSERVLSKVPGMVIQAEVLGTSVADTVVAHYGGAATAGTFSNIVGSTLGGASVGGLLSVAAFDGVRNVIKAGKESRGAEETDKGHLSDVAIGLKYAAVKATEKGAAKRGKKDGHKGDVFDWAIGATDDFTEYTHENKSRLGGAGAGAVGFAWGMALGGPVGAVAGAVISSAATSKTIDALSDAFEKKKITSPPTADKEQAGQSISEKAEDAVASVALKGILLKRRDFIKWDWRVHYFVLEDRELKYFSISLKQSKERKGKQGADFISDPNAPRKILKLVNTSANTEDGLTKPKENLFVFTINSLEQQEPLWVLGASSDEIRQTWVEAINVASKTERQLEHLL